MSCFTFPAGMASTGLQCVESDTQLLQYIAYYLSGGGGGGGIPITPTSVTWSNANASIAATGVTQALPSVLCRKAIVTAASTNNVAGITIAATGTLANQYANIYPGGTYVIDMTPNCVGNISNYFVAGTIADKFSIDYVV